MIVAFDNRHAEGGAWLTRMHVAQAAVRGGVSGVLAFTIACTRAGVAGLPVGDSICDWVWASAGAAWIVALVTLVEFGGPVSWSGRRVAIARALAAWALTVAGGWVVVLQQRYASHLHATGRPEAAAAAAVAGPFLLSSSLFCVVALGVLALPFGCGVWLRACRAPALMQVVIPSVVGSLGALVGAEALFVAASDLSMEVGLLGLGGYRIYLAVYAAAVGVLAATVCMLADAVVSRCPFSGARLGGASP